MVYVKLIAVLVQHWILLTATWCECRRSLMKAAAIIADWVTLLIDALDDLDRLIAVLSRRAYAPLFPAFLRVFHGN